MSHFWWGEDPPPSPPDEAALREAKLVGEPEPPRTWKRWIAPVSTLLSAAFVVFLAVRVAQVLPELSDSQRAPAIQAYFDIIIIAVILTGINALLWWKVWRW